MQINSLPDRRFHSSTPTVSRPSEAGGWRATVVFFSMDALGHINPILSIVKELRRRNYRAIILTTRPLSSASRLEAQGFELDHCEQQKLADGRQSISGKTSEQAMKEIMQPLMANFRLGEKAAYEAAYKIDGAVGKHLNDLISSHDVIESKLKSLKPDLIVYDHVVGIPCATTVAPRWCRVYSGFPSALFSSINDNYCAGLGLRMNEMSAGWKEFEHLNKGPLREKIRRFFLEKNCPDWPAQLELTPTSPHLNFYLGPQELGLEKVEGLKPLPDQWFRLEHTVDEADGETSNGKANNTLPERFEKLPGKLIYFSLGTLVTCDVELINRLLGILSKSPNKFIVSMGQMAEHIKLYENMFGEKFVDQRRVLKTADLFITHGGHNSIIEAFYFGVPGLIVLPVFADQFDSAQRVDDCGFGIRLNPFNCTEDELLKAIDSLLANEKLKQSVQTISARLRSIKYHELACDKLEQIMIKPGAD